MPDVNRSAARRRRTILGLVGAASLAVVGPGLALAQPAEAPEQTPAAPSDANAGEGDAAEAEPSGSRAAPPSDVEVIRIKGRAVSGIETEVPASVTQFTAADLQALGTQNVSDLAKVTPNVEIKTTGATSPTFFIRGVGLSDFSANASGAVAIYRDDVAINAPAIQLTPLYDLENVVVDRGPQSTGSGRNASAGAIRVYSRKPTGDLSSELRSTFGNYDFKDFEGAIEAPLVAENLATRLAFRWTERGPLAFNRCGNKVDAPGVRVCGEGAPTEIPSGLEQDVNDLGNWAARGQLRYQPEALEMDWLLNVHGAKVDQLSTLGQAMGTSINSTTSSLGMFTQGNYQEQDNRAMLTAFGGQGNSAAQRQLAETLALDLDTHPFKGDYNRVGTTTLDTWGASLRGDWTLGPVTLTSISGYEKYDRFRDADQDFTPEVLFEQVAEDDAWQYFQELRVGGELAEFPLRWDVGGYWLMERLSWQDTSFFGALVGARTTIEREYTQDTDSWAAYGEFAWDFLDDFTLEGGVRWNRDEKRFDFTTVSFLPGQPPDVSQSSTEMIGHAPTGTLTLTYRLSEDVASYWKYSRGWKPGTFNSIAKTCPSRFQNPQCSITRAEPETIDAFEAGLKGQWLDGRLQTSVALFYYMYTDYQVFVVADSFDSPPTFTIINANDAELYGAELDLRLEPLVDLVPPELEGLVLTTRAGWLESQFLDFTTSVKRPAGPGGRPIDVQQDFTGNPLINSPRFKVSAAAEWTFDLGRFGSIIPRYDFSWTSDIYFDPNLGVGSKDQNGNTFLPDYAIGQRRYWLHNVRLAYRVPEGNIEIAGWCRNLTDEVYKNYAFDASTFANVVINFVGEPRTYGLDLTIRF